MLIAQISDLHLQAERRPAYGRVDTAAALEAAVTHLNRLDPRPDVVIASGDLVQVGTVAEYALLAEILAPLAIPIFLIVGNHDGRAGLRQVFGRVRYPGNDDDWIQYTIDDWPVRLIALDTQVPGAAHGELCRGRLEWLSSRLGEAPGQPALIFMHHPPFRTGLAGLGSIGLRAGGDELARLIVEHGRIERVLCGHVHRAIHVRWAGTVASTAPSIAHQVALDLRPEAAADAAYVMEPPACQLHLWDAEVGLISHLSFIGAYAGPYRFRDGG